MPDEVVERAAVCSKSVELLNRNAALVLDDAFHAAVNVPHAGYDAAAELMFSSNNKLIGVFRAQAGHERPSAIDEDKGGCGNAAARLAQIVRGIANEIDRKSTRLNSSHERLSRMPS